MDSTQIVPIKTWNVAKSTYSYNLVPSYNPVSFLKSTIQKWILTIGNKKAIYFKRHFS
jgi:hypothetical protein